MNELLQYIAELLERVIALLSRTPQSAEPTPTERQVSDVRIVDLPVPVRLTSATIQAELDEPIDVAQSGTWTVQAQQSGSWTVAISGAPNVNIANQPVQVTFSTPTRKYALIDASSAGNTQVVAAVSGKQIRVVAYAVVSSGTVNVRFRSGANTNLTGIMRLVEAGGIAHAFDGGLFQTNVGESLNINLSTNTQVGGYVVYEEI